ncbi:MAG: hypothetical protein U1E65_10375 [Myxococcota bacterium]
MRAIPTFVFLAFLGACSATGTPPSDNPDAGNNTQMDAAEIPDTGAQPQPDAGQQPQPDAGQQPQPDGGQPTCNPDAPSCPGAGPNNGCQTGFVCNPTCACEPEIPPVVDVLARPSRSTTVDITKDDQRVVMVNTDDGSISVFSQTSTAGNFSLAGKVATSRVAASEPSAVVLHPDQRHAFVANRAAGTVSRIAGIDGAAPSLDGEVNVGAEPVGLALSPTGRKLWVTDWVNGTVTVVNTETMTVLHTIDVGGNPFAIAMTNNTDNNDDDETVLVTQFYARPKSGVAVPEGNDVGKVGVVQVIPANTNGVSQEIELNPLTPCFTGAVGNPPTTVTSSCFPNQLYGITIHKAFNHTRAYVTSVAASPQGPTAFNHNVQAVVSVIDVDTKAEEQALTVNLNEKIKEQQIDTDMDDSIGRRFLNTPVGIDFVNRDDLAIGYVASAASDIVLRVVWDAAGAVTVGSGNNFNIPVGQNPQGIVIKHGTLNAGAFVGNLISRDLSIVSFRDQRQVFRTVSTAQPTDTTSDAFKIWRGKRFFNTSTGLWSKEGWGSCQGCHPFGLADNVTWHFGSGARQTISLDGQYASQDRTDMRALNWTAINDETADFENNVRGVSGGKGALQNATGALVSPMGPAFSSILAEDGATRENHQGLNGSLKFLAHNNQICTNGNTCPDWDLVDAYIQSIRSPRAKSAPPASVASGRAIFEDGGCNKCHAGPKWTVSRTFHQPERFTGVLPMRIFDVNRAFTTAMNPAILTTLPRNVNHDATLVAGDDSGGGLPALKRSACNIRDVGTFNVGGGAAETRDNGSAGQGANGFNPPSLLGLSVSAPYLHHGAAKTLPDLFDARFSAHTVAGNPNFAPSEADKASLSAFLLSIDESTAPFAILPETVLCPTGF